MASRSRTSIAALPRGHELQPATFTLTRDQIDAYLRAVGDGGDYGDAAPPLAVLAHALMAVQTQVWLPEGSLHTGQEAEHERDVLAGAGLTLRGRIAQRSERQGYVVSMIELEVSDAAGTAMRARSTIMAPGGGA